MPKFLMNPQSGQQHYHPRPRSIPASTSSSSSASSSTTLVNGSGSHSHHHSHSHSAHSESHSHLHPHPHTHSDPIPHPTHHSVHVAHLHHQHPQHHLRHRSTPSSSRTHPHPHLAGGRHPGHDDFATEDESGSAGSTVFGGDDDDVHEIEEFLDKLRTESEEAGENANDEEEGDGERTRMDGGGKAGAHPALREEYFENDGVVPIFSQWHPGTCDDETCIHYTPLTKTARLPTSHLHAKQIPRPGIWNVITIEDSHHLSLMPMWVGSMKQRTFWYGLGEWLEEVDAARVFVSVMDGSKNVMMRKDGRRGDDTAVASAAMSPSRSAEV